MRTLDELIEAVHAEAARAEFPIDTPVYERAKKDPKRPVLFAGSLGAKVCAFGRDLGKDEVARGQPLVGSGGRLVRLGLIKALGGGEPKPSDRWLEEALALGLLTNTVPYKPPGNKAYSNAVKERFRPFVAELLAVHWKGDRVLTLGTEAFQWFAPYAAPGAAEALWKREDRYEAELPCRLAIHASGKEIGRDLVVCPLPHPSPLNQRWYAQFPDLLQTRLARSE
jgi:uracil-DNA glycosylase